MVSRFGAPPVRTTSRLHSLRESALYTGNSVSAQCPMLSGYPGYGRSMISVVPVTRDAYHGIRHTG